MLLLFIVIRIVFHTSDFYKDPELNNNVVAHNLYSYLKGSELKVIAISLTNSNMLIKNLICVSKNESVAKRKILSGFIYV